MYLMMPSLPALVAACLCTLLAALQVALALGAPWGRLAWGGAQRVLGAGRRVASALAALYLLLAAGLLLEAGGLGLWVLPPWLLTWAPWLLAAQMALNTVANLASRSRAERWVSGPLSGALMLLCAWVAWGG